MLVTSGHRDALNHRLAPIIHGVWVLGWVFDARMPFCPAIMGGEIKHPYRVRRAPAW